MAVLEQTRSLAIPCFHLWWWLIYQCETFEKMEHHILVVYPACIPSVYSFPLIVVNKSIKENFLSGNKASNEHGLKSRMAISPVDYIQLLCPPSSWCATGTTIQLH